MTYLLIIFTFALAILGLCKDRASIKWRRHLVVTIVFFLFIVSLLQVFVVYNEQRKAKYARNTGRLRSSFTSDAQYPILQLCQSGLKYTGDPNKPALKLGDDSIYIRLVGGEAKLSMIVRDEHGIVRAMIRDNVWFVPSSEGVLDRNFTDDSLEIIGPKNEIILQVQVAGEKIRIAGTTYTKDGNGPFSLSPFLHDCDGRHKTMFQYPSSEFPGELTPLIAQPSAAH